MKKIILTLIPIILLLVLNIVTADPPIRCSDIENASTIDWDSERWILKENFNDASFNTSNWPDNNGLGGMVCGSGNCTFIGNGAWDEYFKNSSFDGINRTYETRVYHSNETSFIMSFSATDGFEGSYYTNELDTYTKFYDGGIQYSTFLTPVRDTWTNWSIYQNDTDSYQIYNSTDNWNYSGYTSASIGIVTTAASNWLGDYIWIYEGYDCPSLVADTTPPILTIEYPINNSFISANFNINGTSTDATAVDNTSINDSRWDIEGTAEEFNFVNNTFLADGNYSVNITTNDTEGYEINKIIDFIIDTIAPNWTIRTFSIDNSSFFYSRTQNITLSDSVFDLNLENATINITNSTQVMYNKTLNSTNGTNSILNFTDIVDVSDWENGFFNVSYYGKDNAGNIQYIEYFFQLVSNNAPAIAGLNIRTDPIIKRGTQYIDFTLIDDFDNDPLTLYCCKDDIDLCIPSSTNDILTGGNRISVSNYSQINGSYTVGIEPYTEFIRCRVYDNDLYSNTVSNLYTIIASGLDPIIYAEYFRYSDEIRDHGWFTSPYNESFIPFNYTLILDQSKVITLTKYINRTKIPLVTVTFELNISGSDPVGFGIYRWNEKETYKLIPETILSLTFSNSAIWYKNKTIGSYNLSGLHTYELNLYFKTTRDFYNNDTKSVESLGYDTFILQQDGIVLNVNNEFYANTTKYDDYYFDRLVWYKSADVNLTLDTIIVYEGDNLIYNNIFEVLNPTNETGWLESFGGFEETNSYDFDCVRFPKCCEWITSPDGTQRQVASKTLCVFGTVAKGWMYGSGNKKGLMYHIEENFWGFIITILIFVFVVPVIIALRKKYPGESK